MSQTDLFNQLAAVTGQGMWAQICREIGKSKNEKLLPALTIAVKEQAKDNPKMMRGMLGDTVYNLIMKCKTV